LDPDGLADEAELGVDGQHREVVDVTAGLVVWPLPARLFVLSEEVERGKATESRCSIRDTGIPT